jgi:hypothetical protein
MIEVQTHCVRKSPPRETVAQLRGDAQTPDYRTTTREGSNTMLSKTTMALVAALILNGTPAFAQVGDMPAPIGMTSPLGIGLGSPVGPSGIPLGATEIATPGVSPPPLGTSTLGSGTAIGSGCSGAAQIMSAPIGSLMGSMGVPTGSAMPFDGGGNAGTPSGTCASAGSGTTTSPTMGASAPVPRTGIPMEAVDLNPGGLSPPPTAQPPSLAMPPVRSPPMPSSTLPSAPPSSVSLSTGGIMSTSPTRGGSMLSRGR